MVATVWLALVMCWGLGAPVGGGHWSVVASRGIIADNMLTWHIWGPVREYTFVRPPAQLYYAHHPWGTFWVIKGLTKLFGRHLFVPRLEPALMTVASPALLYGIGRGLWGPVPGALAALAYAVLPITLMFGSFPGFEVPLIFGCLLTTWGYVRLAERWKRRWMVVSLAGVLWTANTDWEGCIFLGIVLGTLLVTSYLVPPRYFGRVDTLRFGQWWSIAVCLIGFTLFAYFAYFKHIGAIEDLLKQETKREKGNDIALGQVLDGRSYWIDVCFTPVAVTVGKIALPVFLLRLLLMRRPLEIFPLAILLMAGLQYVRFKNGADVHVYWPQPFAPYWALSLGVLAHAVIGGVRFAMRQRGRFDPRGIVPIVVLASLAILPLGMVRDALLGLRYARETGGRLNDRGRRIFQDIDKSVAAGWMSQRMLGPTRVQVHSSMHGNWSIDWALHRPTVGVDALPNRTSPGEDRYFLADLAFLTSDERRKLADNFHVVAVGQFVLVDREEEHAPADGYSFVSREPTTLEWYLTAGTDPIRTIRPDPWYTWELRDHFGQGPNPKPADPPSTLDEVRIAHNAAVAGGDSALADRYQAQLVDQLDVRPSTKFTDGTLLLGQRYTPGVAPTLDEYFLAAGPAAADIQFDIEAAVQRGPLGSLVGPDPLKKLTGMPLVLPPMQWRGGYIYVDRTEIRHRPGREIFSGFFVSPEKTTPPQPLNGSKHVLLLTLP